VPVRDNLPDATAREAPRWSIPRPSTVQVLLESSKFSTASPRNVATVGPNFTRIEPRQVSPPESGESSAPGIQEATTSGSRSRGQTRSGGAGMTVVSLREGMELPGRGAATSVLRHQSFFDRLDLQRQIFGVDAALREAAGHEPEPLLCGALPHVAHLAVLADAPHLADLVRDLVAEETAHQFLLRVVTRRKHQQVSRHDAAVLQPRPFGHEALDVVELQQADLAVDDEAGAAGVEIIAAATPAIFHL